MLNQDRLIFLIYLVVIAIPFLATVGLPLPVSDLTRSFYSQLQDIPEDGAVLWATDIGFSLWVEIGSGEVAIYKTLFNLAREKNVKLVFWSTSSEGAVLAERTIENDIKPGGFADGLTYGVDYVHLGWIPGWESAMASMRDNIHESAPTDWYGTSINQLKIMENLSNLNDFDLVGWSGYYVDEYARQWTTGYSVPLITNLSATTVAMAKPWFEKGLVSGYLNGQRGCAEFEAVTGFKGFATSAIDAQSLAHLYGVLLLIVPNIYFLLRGGQAQKR